MPQAPVPAPPDELSRCLIVDDDPLVRRSLGRVVRAIPMEVTEAESGEEALARLAESPATLVIADLYMGGMDGIELLRRIGEEYPDAAVLIITGVSEVRTAVECLKLGALDYLSKPLLVEEVRSRVEGALEKRRLRLDNDRLRHEAQETLARRLRELRRENQEMFLGQIHMAVRMLEAKDGYTRGHSQRVAIYATRTAAQLGLTGDLLHEVRLGGELHDIGKIGTRDTVLNKPGPLTPEEFAEIKRHTVEGEEILDPLRRDHPSVLQIVRSHHEHLSGRGFPDGLAGPAIPLPARIVSVADAFDAMTTDRAYRPPRTVDEAFGELVRCTGVQFDPPVVRAFRQAFPDAESLPQRVE